MGRVNSLRVRAGSSDSPTVLPVPSPADSSVIAQATPARRRRRALRQAVCEMMEERLLLSKTIYVDVNSPATATNGPTWDTAYTDLQAAMGVAVSGDTILLADGTYKPTSWPDRTISFQLVTGVAIYGGYAGYGAPNPDARDLLGTPSILSGDIGSPGISSDNSYHVLTSDSVSSSCTLDGITVTGGNANGSGTNQNVGGGMYNSLSNPTLTNCAFIGNSTAYGFGGGMYNSTSNPTLTDCTFSGNSSSGGSGGGYGGAMFNSASSSPTLTNCTFSGNSATMYGAAMGNEFSSSPTLTNCILWGNIPASPQIYQAGGATIATYCDIQGGFTGTGNINADPKFVRSPWTGADGVFGTADDDRGDLRLRSGSPALDAGYNAAVAGIATDAAGNARIQNNTVDMGPYEGALVGVSKTIYVDNDYEFSGRYSAVKTRLG